MSWSDLGVPEPTGNSASTPNDPVPPKPSKPPKPPKAAKPAKEPREQRGPQGPREPGARTPILLAVIAGILLVAVIVTLVIAFTRGTGAAPTPTQTPDGAVSAPTDPTPSPTTSSANEVGEPVALDFSATGFTLVDAADREVFAYGWADAAADAVAELTEAFGAAPTQRVEPGDGSHYPDYTVYQWDGFMLFDMVETADGTPRADYPQPSYALFSRNEVGGIELVAEHDLTIGMPVAAVRALGPDAEIPRGNVGAIRFVFDKDRSNADGPPQYSVFADTDGAVVTAILYFRYSDL